MTVQQLQGLIVPIGFLAIFYLFAIRPQRKKEKGINEMRSALREGDEIITIGGIIGKIIKVKQDIITIEVGTAKTKLDVSKWAIGSLVKKNESKRNDETEVKDENTDSQDNKDN